MMSREKFEAALRNVFAPTLALVLAVTVDNWAGLIGSAIWMVAPAVILLFVGSIVWDIFTSKFADMLYGYPGKKFVGVWQDVVWKTELGENVPTQQEDIVQTSWIQVKRKNGQLSISGFLYNHDSLKRRNNNGSFHIQHDEILFPNEMTLTSTFRRKIGKETPTGYSEYSLVQPHISHNTPTQWNGHLILRKGASYYTKAEKISKERLKKIKTAEDMADAMSAFLEKQCTS